MNINVEDKIEMRPLNEVRPYVRNPRKNARTVELLCQIIPKVGFNVPIVVDKKGIIVKGHARFFAAVKLGLQEVPVIVSHADEEAIKVDRITDNKISEFSEWVDADLMREIDELDFDLSDLGLAKITLDDVPTAEDVMDDEEPLTDEDREEMYEELTEGMSEEEIQEAEEEYLNAAFYKLTCEKCGHVMFIKDGELEDDE